MPGLGQPQVVEAEVGGQRRLVVPAEERSGRADVGPLGEAGAPPLVVLRDRMELRQVEGDRARRLARRAARVGRSAHRMRAAAACRRS